MRSRCAGVIAGSLAAASLLCVSGASAATEVGNVCTGNSVSNVGFTLIQVVDVSSPLPLTVQTAGVVTKWRAVNGLAQDLKQQLKVARAIGKLQEFQAVGESAIETLSPGFNAFDAQIAVRPGDRFGLRGGPGTGTLFCSGGNIGDGMGLTSNSFTTGDPPSNFGVSAENQVAVSAVVEPDADADGFGDETQDRCAQLAAFQDDCPITLDTVAVVRRGAIILLVIADREAPVTVTASTGVGLKPGFARAMYTVVATLKGGTQTVRPNQISRFKLPFTSRLKAMLRKLPRGKSLKLAVTASAENAARQVSTKRTTVKLKGRAGSG